MMNAYPVGSYAVMAGDFEHHPQWRGAVVRIVEGFGWNAFTDEPDENFRVVEFDDGSEFIDGLYRCSLPVEALRPIQLQ